MDRARPPLALGRVAACLALLVASAAGHRLERQGEALLGPEEGAAPRREDLVIAAAPPPNASRADAALGGSYATRPEHALGSFHWEHVWHAQVLACCVVLYLAGVLCSAGGIGGGGVFVAALMIAGGLSPRDAVPLSKAIVFLGAVSSLMVNLGAKDPWGLHSGRRVIDLNTCRLVVPAALCGTFIGVLLNFHTQDTAIVVLLSALLVAMTCMVVRAAWGQYREEEAAAEGPAGGLLSALGEPDAAADRGVARNPQDDDGIAAGEDPPGDAAQAEAEEGAQFQRSGARDLAEVAASSYAAPSREDVVIAALLSLIVVSSGTLRVHMKLCRAELLLAPGGAAAAGGACAHPVAAVLLWGRLEGWMADEAVSEGLQRAAIALPVAACVAASARYAGVASKSPEWTTWRVLAYQAVGVVTGVFAGLTGVGGGLILSPFLLLAGLDAAVAVGTSSTCVLFTSMSTTTQYLLTDRIVLSLALVYGAVTFAASHSGTVLVHRLQGAGARRSYISAVVALGVALSAVLSLAKLTWQLRA